MSMQMIKSVNISSPGDVSVMEFKDMPLGELADNEVTIQHKAIGLNFIDIYHRQGIYPIPMPSFPGREACSLP